jgi:DNA-binding LytR/AlgR family response regulator
MSTNRIPHSKVLLHLNPNLRRVIDPAGVYFLEAVGGDTLLRRRGARRFKDVRRLGDIMKVWRNRGFVRIHRNHAVNVEHILEIRRRTENDLWEVKLAPPVNRVLPVSRNYLNDLWAAFGQR